MMDNEKVPVEERVPWKGWIALAVLVILLSGVFQQSTTFLKAFDFTNLSGAFGTISVPRVAVNQNGSVAAKPDGTVPTTVYTYQGAGGTGAREGIMVAIGLLPLTAFAFGLIEWAQSMGAMEAAERLFRHILRPLYGLPGICGIAYVASFTSSDIGALMTRQMTEDKELTEDERTIFIAYQYPATAVIGNTISTQAALLPYVVLSTGGIILVLWVCKTIGANLVRLLISFEKKMQKGTV